MKREFLKGKVKSKSVITLIVLVVTIIVSLEGKNYPINENGKIGEALKTAEIPEGLKAEGRDGTASTVP